MKFQLKPNVEFTQTPPSIHRALQEGDENPQISNQQELSLFYYYLELVKKRGLLLYQTPLIELNPFNGDFCCQKGFKGSYHLSRFALCRREEGELVIETPLSPARVHIRTPEGLHFFSAFCEKMSLEEAVRRFAHLPAADVEETFSLLCSAKIFTDDEESPTMEQWEFHDLYFHSRSRIGRQDAPLGGTFRFIGKLPTTPALKTCSGETFDLPKPEHELKLPIGQVFAQRKSIREHGKRPITIQQLGEFLYHAARVKKIYMHNEEEFTSRPYPGGGARYELEIYLVVHACEGLEQGVYHYHPGDHQLCIVSPLNKDAEKLLAGSKRSTGKEEYPQILFVFGARFQRVAWKYQSMAYALMLKNTGILYQTFYLVATAMGLAPCGVGAGDSDLFCKVFGTDYLKESSIGEFMLGSCS